VGRRYCKEDGIPEGCGALDTYGDRASSLACAVGFDIVAMLQGTYEVGRLSSLYGVGSSWLELQREIEEQRNDTTSP
jgi:hypothetical protein